MIEYEELCAALERYVARTGGVPMPRASVPAPQPAAPRAPLQVTTSVTRTAAPAPSPYEPPTKENVLPPLEHHDEPHDPDFGSLGAQHDEDATHVGSSPAKLPVSEDHSTEIDIVDVLSDDEL